MSTKRVGWCRIKEELVLDQELLKRPFLQDDLDTYSLVDGESWWHWTPESQHYVPTVKKEVPEMIQLAMLMLP